VRELAWRYDTLRCVLRCFDDSPNELREDWMTDRYIAPDIGTARIIELCSAPDFAGHPTSEHG
jgi:hypothetical protein